MKKIKLISLILTSLFVLVACTGNPNAPVFELTPEQEAEIRTQLDEVLVTIESEEQINGDNYLHLGELYARLNDHRNSLESYQKAAEFQPNSALVHANISTSHEYLGDIDAAIASIDTALEIAPDYAPNYLKKAKLLRFNKGQSAFDMGEFYRNAVSLTNNDTGIARFAAEHYESEGTLEGEAQALTFYRIILRKNSADTESEEKIKELEAKIKQAQLES